MPITADSPASQDRLTWFLRLVTFLLLVAALRVAADVLIPMVFAILLAFLLSPLVVRLVRWGVPRSAAILLAVTMAAGVLGLTGWIVATQALRLVQELPNYEENIRQKIVILKHTPMPPVVSRVSGMVENLRREIKAPSPKAVSPAPAAGTERPVPVEVKPSDPTPLELATDFVPAGLQLLGTGAIVVVFVIMILFQWEDLRDRMIRLLSAGRLNLATQALDDATARVSRFLGMQLVVNAAYGVPLGLGLHFIGIPNAALWGLLATLLRFVPFVGPWIAAVFPVTLAIAVDPHWSMLLYTIGLFLVMELVSNNIVEVLLYGASTGISNFALLLAAVFWTWLWGAPGLVLSTPLTVCVLVLGTYVPGLNLFATLLGSQPVRDPSLPFYQRMLAMDTGDMIALAGKHLREHSLDDFHARVFLPALELAGKDVERGALSGPRQRFIFLAARELLDELERRYPEPPPLGAAEGRMGAPPGVLLVPVRDPADELAAAALRHLLALRRIPALVTSGAPAAPEVLAAARRSDVQAVVFATLSPAAAGGIRRWLKCLREDVPGKPLLAGIWGHRASREEVIARLHGLPPSELFTTLAPVVDRLASLLPGRDGEPPERAASGAPASTPTPADQAPPDPVTALSGQKIAPE